MIRVFYFRGPVPVSLKYYVIKLRTLAIRLATTSKLRYFRYEFTSKQFYRAALNIGRSSHEKAICLSVGTSVKRVHCDETEERFVQIIIPYKRTFSLVFGEEE